MTTKRRKISAFAITSAEALIDDIMEYNIVNDYTCAVCDLAEHCKAYNEPYTENCKLYDNYVQALEHAEEFIDLISRALRC